MNEGTVLFLVIAHAVQNKCSDCVCRSKAGIGTCVPSVGDVADVDFCFPAVFTVTATVFDRTRDDATISVIRRDNVSGFERVDYLDAQGGAGDLLRGFTIRSAQSEWHVSLDRDGHVEGCTKLPRARPELPECIVTGAHYGGEAAAVFAEVAPYFRWSRS